jgi:hypothetical protein
MTTRTDDSDESHKITIAAEAPVVTDAPAITSDADRELQPEASVLAAEADTEVNPSVATADAYISEPFDLEREIAESVRPEPVFSAPAPQDVSVPAAILAEGSISSPRGAPPADPKRTPPQAAAVAPAAPPVPPAPRAAPPLAPPFLREHERRPTGGRPAPAVAHVRKPAAPPPAAPKATSRFPLLAATLALAAGLGAAVGAIGISTLTNSAPGTASAAAPGISQTAEIESLKTLVAHQAADLGALKASIEHGQKATAALYGKIVERLDRSERAQAEPSQKLARIVETLERLEKRPVPAAAGDITGTIPTPPPQPEAKPKPTILDDYVLRRVFDGVALVEGRRGIIEVEPGATLPGAGRVEEIRRQDGRWVVVTQKGLIVSPR